VLVIVILRFAYTSRDEERHANELEAARVVQQVLVPDENPSIPGFTIQSVYQPAAEVGGDFFQVVATGSGGALIVIGDVSGKGMPAAMTVSLLVGTFRTLAHYTESPGEILSAMNERMLGRSNGGFTTCLVLRIDQDGQIAAANAGHIAPYAGGREMSVENSLPLGLAADATYVETASVLAPDSQLTLLTDGVIEARSSSGELFGFDRTAAISTQSAEEIAQHAQHFGQEDDIAVLTLKFAVPDVSPASFKNSNASLPSAL
jgi:serine phosphatase RsbU (regulator of sigma subunit)